MGCCGHIHSCRASGSIMASAFVGLVIAAKFSWMKEDIWGSVLALAPKNALVIPAQQPAYLKCGQIGALLPPTPSERFSDK